MRALSLVGGLRRARLASGAAGAKAADVDLGTVRQIDDGLPARDGIMADDLEDAAGDLPSLGGRLNRDAAHG